MSNRIWKHGVLVSKDCRLENEDIKSAIFDIRLKQLSNFVPSYSLNNVEQELARRFPDYFFRFSTEFEGDDLVEEETICGMEFKTAIKNHFILTVNRGNNLIVGNSLRGSYDIALRLIKDGAVYKFVEIEEAYVDERNPINLLFLAKEMDREKGLLK